jgi:hypothetical protein
MKLNVQIKLFYPHRVLLVEKCLQKDPNSEKFKNLYIYIFIFIEKH